MADLLVVDVLVVDLPMVDVTGSAGDDLATGLVTGQDGDVDFAYVSGDPALDLAGTVVSRRDLPLDGLGAPGDLERWVAECEGLPDRVTADHATFLSALSLREAVYRLALDRLLDRPFDPDSLRIVNGTAAGPVPTISLGDDGLRMSGSLGEVLSHIARGAVAVLSDPDAHLKECGRPTCTRVYLDRSRGARRTWCGMDECGNRVKAAAYRARRRASTTANGHDPTA
ncbi:CGNR zinc finger domain-containing protein [Streptomyces sp. NPDC058653]|uniref:CGNR zinc finger domain-containing protein n=1 Tax=Streptomyces sp. NPDC058653 TaxID=3346576 RepID=UPI0036585FAE